MPYRELGPRAYTFVKDEDSIALSPLSDRAAIVRQIAITNPDNPDTWDISCAGRIVGTYRVDTDGNQHLLGRKTSLYPKTNDIFSFLKEQANLELIYPIPQGTTLSIASRGGAKAAIDLEYTEHLPSEVTNALMNHPTGHRFVAPIFATVAATIAAAGDYAFDTEYGLDWVPNLFLDGTQFQGWRISILGLFLEAASANAYASTTDHIAGTDHLALQLNGQEMFTRDAGSGIPLVAEDAAAGSINTTFDALINGYPAFQEADTYDYSMWDVPLMVADGFKFLWRLAVTGDPGAGIDLSKCYQVAICDFTEVTG